MNVFHMGHQSGEEQERKTPTSLFSHLPKPYLYQWLKLGGLDIVKGILGKVELKKELRKCLGMKTKH